MRREIQLHTLLFPLDGPEGPVFEVHAEHELGFLGGVQVKVDLDFDHLFRKDAADGAGVDLPLVVCHLRGLGRVTLHVSLIGNEMRDVDHLFCGVGVVGEGEFTSAKRRFASDGRGRDGDGVLSQLTTAEIDTELFHRHFDDASVVGGEGGGGDEGGSEEDAEHGGSG